MKVRLVDIAHARSGDKGDTANVGVIALRPEWYPLIASQLTLDRVRKHFEGVITGGVERFELPNLRALNFLLHGALGGGGTLSLKTDAQGKVFSTAMLRMVLDVPDAEAASLDLSGGAGMTRVKLLRDGAIGRIILARPEKRNALDRQAADDLFAALAQFEADAACRVVHLGAEGEDFCAGADLEALERTLDDGSDAHRADAEALGRVFLAIRALMKPVVCTVRGRALAGGAGLATACDMVLAHEDAEFGYPEVRIGFVPAMVMTMLRRAVGEKHAADLVLTGRIISAEEAERIGLVSRVVPAATYDDEINATLEQISQAAPTSLALTKWLFHKLDSLSFEDGIAAGVVTNVESRATEDFKAGVRRFVQRKQKE